MKRNPIFKDKRKLCPNYVLEKLTGRNEEMRELVCCFKPVERGSRPEDHSRRPHEIGEDLSRTT
ncbi:MAG: hypothetical protein ACLFUR_05220 [Candidatus Hadarchaeia archaeon]